MRQTQLLRVQELFQGRVVVGRQTGGLANANRVKVFFIDKN
jgi:hypothetical protein